MHDATPRSNASHHEVLHSVQCDALGLIQRLLNFQVTLPIQVDGFHVCQIICALGHRQQQQVSRKERVFQDLQDIPNLQAMACCEQLTGVCSELPQMKAGNDKLRAA